MDESKFIADCAARSITSPQGIVAEAGKRVKEIDAEIQRVDILRKERTMMIGLIKMFGFDAPKSSRKSAPVISDDATQDQLDEQTLANAIKLCELIGRKGSMKPASIFQEWNILPSDAFEIYNVIKWLCQRGILVRNDDRSVGRGPSWESRPSMDFGDSSK